MDGATAADVLARLEAMAVRLDEQATKIAAQEAEIARLKAGAPQSASRAAGEEGPCATTRRGLLRSGLVAGAAVAAMAALRVTPAHANDPNDILASGNTTTSVGAALIKGGGASLLPAVFVGANFNGSSFPNPYGRIGVRGAVAGTDTTTEPHYGVYGHVDGDVPNAGVAGRVASAIGVLGSSSSGYGVAGSSSGSSGVYGLSISAEGVRGESTDAVGIFGQSRNSHGCGGTTAKAGQAGLFGLTGTNGAVAMLGVHTGSGGTAAFFQGTVTVVGALQVIGGPKNALVPHPDGSHRRMYSMEAPEPWFEDFGTAQLVNGRAVVDLDPDFDAVVRGDDYLVFLTPSGAGCGSLYVSRKGPHRFEVASFAGATAAGTFDYRLVSRRKEDVGKRLEKVQIPAIDIDKLKRDVAASADAKPVRGKPGAL